ncbi:MAG: hypothetical protein OJF47_001964 [Nitrospira sp.]|jgi:hypothetical protein|nr:MAG: hypothetical protein OJF47_001964 [Nitrospira sp.]
MGKQMDTVHVYDTWVKGKKGTLHFDVMTTTQDLALTLAKKHLVEIGEPDAVITLKECQFCHSEPLVMFSEAQQKQFCEQGGFIITLPA